MHREKKKEEMSCWLRLINCSTFQFFITLRCLSGRWGMGKKSIMAQLVALYSVSAFQTNEFVVTNNGKVLTISEHLGLQSSEHQCTKKCILNLQTMCICTENIRQNTKQNKDMLWPQLEFHLHCKTPSQIYVGKSLQ